MANTSLVLQGIALPPLDLSTSASDSEDSTSPALRRFTISFGCTALGRSFGCAALGFLPAHAAR